MSIRTTTIARAVLPEEAQTRLDALLRSAEEAANAGDRARASQALREAALVNPYNEGVWQKLLAVVDSVSWLVSFCVDLAMGAALVAVLTLGRSKQPRE